MQAIVVNLFGGAGIGKSTTSTGVFHLLKKEGINCEYVSEYAKDLTWDRSFNVLGDQLKVFAEQNHRLRRLREQVDVIITDSPLLLSHIYNKSYGNEFEALVDAVFNSYKNINFLLERTKEYNPIGRNETKEEAITIDKKIEDMLKSRGISYITTEYNSTTAEFITELVKLQLQYRRIL